MRRGYVFFCLFVCFFFFFVLSDFCFIFFLSVQLVALFLVYTLKTFLSSTNLNSNLYFQNLQFIFFVQIQAWKFPHCELNVFV